MPLQSRWPLFDANDVDLVAVGIERQREAKYSPLSTQKSRLKGRLRSAASFSSLPASADVAIAHEVRVLVDPIECCARLVRKLPHELAVAGPALVLVEQDDV